MELGRLIKASGFLLSSIVTFSLGILFLDVAASDLISLSGFSFILPLFAGSIILRGITWKRLYSQTKKTLFLVTCILVVVFGFSLFAGFLFYASGQTILYYLYSYSGNSVLIALSTAWFIYSLFEFAALYNLFRGALFNLVRLMILPIVIIESSVVVLLGYLDYLLPAAVFALSFMTLIAGLGFIFD